MITLNLEVFHKNIETIKAHRPLFFKAIESEIKKFLEAPYGNEEESSHIVESSPGVKNLFFCRKNPPTQGLFHALDPIAEARQQINQIDFSNSPVVVMLGMGLGYMLNEFLKTKSRPDLSLVVIENSPRIFLQALSSFDFYEALKSENVFLMVTSDPNHLQSQMNAFAQVYTTDLHDIKFIAHPAAMATNQDFYQRAAHGMFTARDYSTVIGGNMIFDQVRGIRNTLENFDRLIDNPGINPLKNAFAGKVCISVAAGPSLNKNWDFVKKYQRKIPIIACDTVLKPLNVNGIEADFITAMERDDYVPILFRNIPVPKRSHLVGPVLLMKETLDCYQGHPLFYRSHTVFLDQMGVDFFEPLEMVPSTGNLNIALAKFLGFSKVIMIGHDLAYGDKQETHVAGTVDPSREKTRSAEELESETGGLKVATMDGLGSVSTRNEWSTFRLAMQDQIAAAPQVEFINISPKGAKIEGTILKTREEVEALIAQEITDADAIKEINLKPITGLQKQSRLNSIRQGLKVSLENLEHWTKKSQEIGQKINRWKKKIADREVEGKTVSVEFLNDAIDEILAIKVKAINEDLDFYRLGGMVIMPGHLILERELNEMKRKAKNDYTLKKDFVLKHEDYFKIWNQYLPEILDLLKNAQTKHFSDGVTLAAPFSAPESFRSTLSQKL